jgi:hypothetical protein
MSSGLMDQYTVSSKCVQHDPTHGNSRYFTACPTPSRVIGVSSNVSVARAERRGLLKHARAHPPTITAPPRSQPGRLPTRPRGGSRLALTPALMPHPAQAGKPHCPNLTGTGSARLEKNARARPAAGPRAPGPVGRRTRPPGSKRARSRARRRRTDSARSHHRARPARPARSK